MLEYTCPCCGNSAKYRVWYEEGYLVETNISCRCGYSAGNSYGMQYEDFPEGYDDCGNKIEDEGDSSMKFYCVWLRNVFNDEETEHYVETEDLDEYLECNSIMCFQEIEEIEELTEEEYNERTVI